MDCIYRLKTMIRRRKVHRVLGVLMVCVVTGVILYKQLSTDRTRMTEIPIQSWLTDMTMACKGHFTGYGHEFAWLTYARVNKKNRTFSIPCMGKPPPYNFLYGKEGTPLDNWMKKLSVYPYSDINETPNTLRETTTIVVERNEAHNLYHTMCEWYNIFLISTMFNMDPKTLDVLFLDTRPKGLMDESWDMLFGKIIRYNDLKEGVTFKNMIWNIIGYESPLNFHYLTKLHLAEEFHRFFLRSFGIQDTKTYDCRKQLNITIILRHDYMTHPERVNISGGHLHRKFQNEEEIVAVVSNVFKGHNVTTLVLENISMKQQLVRVTQTDVLIGMHGAGMAHAFFLPEHAVVFETFPNYWGFLQHFRAFSRWRNIKYIGWQNWDKKNEFDHFKTRIPPEIVQKHALKAKRYLCPI